MPGHFIPSNTFYLKAPVKYMIHSLLASVFFGYVFVRRVIVNFDHAPRLHSFLSKTTSISLRHLIT